jgi:hypothetical protein
MRVPAAAARRFLARAGRSALAQGYERPTLVVNIEREYFAAILAVPRRKHVEYRNLTDYWLRRLEKVGPAPFHLRMLNGMTPPVPEATVVVARVIKSGRNREIQLHLGHVVEVKYWDREREVPIGKRRK